MWISAIELKRQYKAEGKLEREALKEAQRDQANRNEELKRKNRRLPKNNGARIQTTFSN